MTHRMKFLLLPVILTCVVPALLVPGCDQSQPAVIPESSPTDTLTSKPPESPPSQDAEEGEEQPICKFEFVPNPYGLENIQEAVISAMRAQYGETYHEYIEGSDYRAYITNFGHSGRKYPSIPFEHDLVRIDLKLHPLWKIGPRGYTYSTSPEFCLLVTADKVYFLSPLDFNEFLEIHGSEIDLDDDWNITQLFWLYLSLYGSGGRGGPVEEIITGQPNQDWVMDLVNEEYEIDPDNENIWEITRSEDGNYLLLDCYTESSQATYTRIPSPADLIISHYLVVIGGKGQITPVLLDRRRFEEIIPSGPR